MLVLVAGVLVQELANMGVRIGLGLVQINGGRLDAVHWSLSWHEKHMKQRCEVIQDRQ